MKRWVKLKQLDWFQFKMFLLIYFQLNTLLRETLERYFAAVQRVSSDMDLVERARADNAVDSQQLRRREPQESLLSMRA